MAHLNFIAAAAGLLLAVTAWAQPRTNVYDSDPSNTVPFALSNRQPAQIQSFGERPAAPPVSIPSMEPGGNAYDSAPFALSPREPAQPQTYGAPPRAQAEEPYVER